MYGIKFDKVTKPFGKNTVLKSTSFYIQNGITLFISENGTGKSIIIYSIAGFLRIQEGRITVNGYDPVKNHALALKDISIMPEVPSYFGSGKVSEHIDLFARLRSICSSEFLGI